jgi:hypothetical protein
MAPMAQLLPVAATKAQAAAVLGPIDPAANADPCARKSAGVLCVISFASCVP